MSGGWKQTMYPYVYAVAWDDAGIVKIGQSTRQRWRRFVLRGGRLAMLVEVTDSDMRHLEQQYQAAADTMCSLAFRLGADASPYLGDTGGYLECYRLPDGLTADEMLAQCSRIVREHYADKRVQPMPEHMPRTEKTDALTQMQSPSEDISRTATSAGGQFDSLIRSARIARDVLVAS